MSDALITVITSVIAGLMAINGTLLQRIWAAQNRAEEERDAILKKVQQIEVDVAKTYVARTELDKKHDEVMARFDRLEERIAKASGRVTNFYPGEKRE